MSTLARCLPGLLAVLSGLVVAGGCSEARLPTASFTPLQQHRQPVALVVMHEGKSLLVANRRSGSVSFVDLETGTTVAESAVGERLSDMIAIPGTNRVLVADEGSGRLLQARVSQGELKTIDSQDVGNSPVKLTLSPDGHSVYVACLWPRRVVRVDGIRGRMKQNEQASVDLPFAPREQLFLPDQKHLVVAGAFDGQLAVIDTESASIVSTRNWKAHNIRGLALTRDRSALLIPHQALMDEAATTSNQVHWGAVMMNVIRKTPVDTLFGEAPSPGADLTYLGTMDEAAGDPTGIIVTDSGRRIVAFAGTSEVAISDEEGREFTRVKVDRRPVALALDPAQAVAYVASAFGDSVSSIQLSTNEVRRIELGPPPAELTQVERGEQLFYDAHLSSDGWFSCHSCHTDGHSNGLLNDNFGDESEGAPKRVLSLLTVGETGPWAWTGKVSELEQQVRKSVLTTMRGPEPSEEDVAALTAYLRSLEPPLSLVELRGLADDPRIARGEAIFAEADCASCHPGPTYTSPDAFDVGIHDQVGNSRFNPPSLLGVGHRSLLFHDNRAANLDEVFADHQHGLDAPLSDADREALVLFLMSL